MTSHFVIQVYPFVSLVSLHAYHEQLSFMMSVFNIQLYQFVSLIFYIFTANNVEVWFETSPRMRYRSFPASDRRADRADGATAGRLGCWTLQICRLGSMVTKLYFEARYCRIWYKNNAFALAVWASHLFVNLRKPNPLVPLLSVTPGVKVT